MKLLKLLVISFLLSLFYACNLQIRAEVEWIPFHWEADSLGSRRVEKIAMTVPLKLEGVPYTFHAQFDLGAVTTMLYGKTLSPFMEEYPALKERVDSTKTIWIEGKKSPYIKNIDLTLGEVKFPEQDVALFLDYGQALSDSTPLTKTHIGTIAADLFRGKILIIDYLRQRLASAEAVPAKWNVDFVDVEYIEEMNWIILPMKLGGVECKILFDTGSSLFPLISSFGKIKEIADISSAVDSLSVVSWGREETVYAYSPTLSVSLGNTNFEQLPVYYTESLDDESLDEMGLWGITGNRYFLDKTIIIDYENKKFGILVEK